MYRHAWNRIRQYWTSEMWIRVTDDEDNVRFVGLNQPVLVGDMLAEQLPQDMPPEQKQAAVQQIAADPRSRQPVVENGKSKLKNNVAEMDVDIIIDEAPDTITVQAEEFEKIVRLAESGQVQIPPKALITASQLRSQTKKLIMDQLSGANDPMAQQMAALQAKLGELEVALKAAQVRKTEADAAKSEASAVETQVDSSVKVAEFTSPQAQPAQKTQVSVN